LRPAGGALGLNADQAERTGHRIRVIDLDPGATVIGASLYADGYTGRARIVVEEDHGYLLGVTFVGPVVEELIHSATIAVAGSAPPSSAPPPSAKSGCAYSRLTAADSPHRQTCWPIPRADDHIALSALTACGRVAVARLVREHAAGLPLRIIQSAGGTSPMEPALSRPRHEAIEHDYLMVHEWRGAQLTPLGSPRRPAQAARPHADPPP